MRFSNYFFYGVTCLCEHKFWHIRTEKHVYVWNAAIPNEKNERGNGINTNISRESVQFTMVCSFFFLQILLYIEHKL